MRRRTSKLTRPLIARICQYVRAGNFLETSALACGVTRQSLYNWLRTANEALDAGYGEEPDPAALSVPVFTPLEELCVEFLVAMEQATSEADIADMAIIEAAAQTDWRAAAWRTARRDRRKERDASEKAAAARNSKPNPCAKPTPQTHPEWFKTDEQRRAEGDQRRAQRRSQYLAWKKAREARIAAGVTLSPEEEQHDKEMDREYTYEAYLERTAAAEALAYPLPEASRRNPEQGAATSNGPQPPPKPKSNFVMA